MAPLEAFIDTVLPLVGLLPHQAYLSTLGWSCKLDSEGTPSLLRTQNREFIASSAHFSVDQLIEYAADHGYAPARGVLAGASSMYSSQATQNFVVNPGPHTSASQSMGAPNTATEAELPAVAAELPAVAVAPIHFPEAQLQEFVIDPAHPPQYTALGTTQDPFHVINPFPTALFGENPPPEVLAAEANWIDPVMTAAADAVALADAEDPDRELPELNWALYMDMLEGGDFPVIPVPTLTRDQGMLEKPTYLGEDDFFPESRPYDTIDASWNY